MPNDEQLEGVFVRACVPEQCSELAPCESLHLPLVSGFGTPAIVGGGRAFAKFWLRGPFPPLLYIWLHLLAFQALRVLFLFLFLLHVPKLSNRLDLTAVGGGAMRMCGAVGVRLCMPRNRQTTLQFLLEDRSPRWGSIYEDPPGCK